MHTPSDVAAGTDRRRDARRLCRARLSRRDCRADAGRRRRALIEVFPHAAAIVLVGRELSRAVQARARGAVLARRDRPRRGAARCSRTGASCGARSRRGSRGGGLRVPSTGTIASLKRYEDALDALICAWVGTEYLAGRLRAHGDATAAVWAH